jgi:hypothetical protein
MTGKAAIFAAVILLMLPAVSVASLFTLTNTISLAGVDIANIASDGTHLLVLGNVHQNDPIGIYTPSGQLLQTYQTGLGLSALAWTGSNLVALQGVSNDLVYRISLPSGPNSGPFGVGPFVAPNGLGFDGSDLLFADTAFGTAGVLTVTLHEVDPANFATLGSQSVVINTGTTITGTPVYDVAVHNGDLFLGLGGVNNVYEFSSGNLVQTIPVPTSSGPGGIAFVGNDMFVADRPNSNIYELSPAIPEPGTYGLALLGGLAFVVLHAIKGKATYPDCKAKRSASS